VESLRLLTSHGLEIEQRIAGDLGYETVAPDPEDPAAAFAHTLDLMRRGVRGIYQGVLFLEGGDDRAELLAIPDLLRRAEGESDLGPFHYVPGDIKSGLEPRTDQVLQVVFAARLLEPIQGRRPERGFLLMGEGEEAGFDIADVWESAELAFETVERIARGGNGSFPALCRACARCRWRGICLPALQDGPDLSLVAGMTRTRKRLLVSQDILTVEDVAMLDGAAIRTLEEKGLATDGLARLREQAKALVKGEIRSRGRRRTRRLPGAGLREHFLLAERDPLGGGEPFLIGIASRPGAGEPVDRMEVLLAGDDGERVRVTERLLERLGEGQQAIFHYGDAARRSFERLADLAGVDAASQGRIEGRFVDLGPLVRAGGYFPVRRYRFEEIAPAIAGRPLPPLDEPEDEPFVWFENRRREVPGDWAAELEARAKRDLQDLVRVRDWVRSNMEDR
jgi:predicted RecB family nuclease